MEINEVVDNWDLSLNEKEEKEKILKIWEESIPNSQEFDFLLRICFSFNYYSRNITSSSFRKNFNVFIKNYDNYKDDTIFFPLRTKSRLESSMDLFSNFRITNNIQVSYTNVDKCDIFLKNYSRVKEEHSLKKSQYNKEKEERSEIIENLKMSLETNQNYDKYVIKSVEKKIKNIEKEQQRAKLNFKTYIENIYNQYLFFRRIVVIDDFIGTGESFIRFLKSILMYIQNYNIEIVAIVLESSKIGIESIELFANENQIRVSVQYFKLSIGVLEADYIFESKEIFKVNQMINRIKKNNYIKSSYYSLQLASATYNNIPNNNLELLIQETSKWKPIFKREKKYQIEREIPREYLKDLM